MITYAFRIESVALALLAGPAGTLQVTTKFAAMLSLGGFDLSMI